MKQNIGIVGLGLIGASLAMAIKQNTEHNVYGLDINEQTMHRALEEGSIDGVLEDYGALDLLIVALFPQAAVELILDKVEQMKPGSIVMDICGVKKSVVTQVAQVCKSHKVEFIGGHPMAGRERWGYENATATLFNGASMILTPIFTDSWALERVQQLCNAVGFGRIVFTDPESHDKMIGYTSQLAHILSSAYIKNPLCMNYKGYTGGSFQDLTRVARLNPVMWSELFLLNRQNLLDDLDILIASLQEYRHAIEENDAQRLTQLLADGSRIKEALNEE
ncbi:prephenate dehydrogenase [uncultured Negativibacillus sp.]|uniref:prephenate dehydrogenase n=1 Tax=uncultured Negativibacillus sp. TaxID=1980696 RepID=UPI0025D646A2|nr:prephenate dehydrogenase [uncultured Negativibacillus sp.]